MKTENQFAIQTNSHGEVVKIGRSYIEMPQTRCTGERKTKWFNDSKLLKKLVE